MHKVAFCLGVLLCCLSAMAQEQADTATTKIVRHKSTSDLVWFPHDWVVNVGGNEYGILECKASYGSQSDLIFASKSVRVPFGVDTILAICVLLLLAAVIIPVMAFRRKI